MGLQGKGRRLSLFPCPHLWRSPAVPTRSRSFLLLPHLRGSAKAIRFRSGLDNVGWDQRFWIGEAGLAMHRVALGFATMIRVRYKGDKSIEAELASLTEGNGRMAEETTPQSTAPTAPPAAAPPSTAAAAPAAPVTAESAPAEPKIKVRKPRQRACDEKPNGKLCGGHLKRWYDYPKEVEKKIGKRAEIYRCEFCQTLYKPDPKQMPHSFTLRY